MIPQVVGGWKTVLRVGNYSQRSNQPELLHGTLRQNLDPFSQYDDLELNDVLKSSGLSSFQDGATDPAKLTLDSAISGGGSNVSVGQRQMIALSRALLRRSKLIILDEGKLTIILLLSYSLLTIYLLTCSSDIISR